MELSTPNKTQTAPPPAQFEDSPVFNYINNLSPIELVKSARIDQTFHSLSFVSPQSVFASPQIAALRDTTRSFIKRHQLSDLSKPEAPKDDEKTSEAVSEARSSGKEATTEPPSGDLGLAIALPNALNSDCDSPGGTMVPLNAISTDLKPDMTGQTDESDCLYGTDKDLRKIGRTGKNEDEAGCDWVALISDVADILTDSTIVEEQTEEQKMVDPGTISFISNVLQVPQENTNDSKHMGPECCGSSPEKGDKEEQAIQPVAPGEVMAVNETPSAVPDTPFSKQVVDNTTAKLNVKGKRSSQSSRKQPQVRRRCLVFEVMGAHKRKSLGDPSSSLISSQPECEVTHVEQHSKLMKIENSDALFKLSGKGIGLHLNSLATSSTEGKMKLQIAAAGKQEIDLVSSDNKHDIVDNDTHTSEVGVEDFSITSPDVKRAKVEKIAAACKRCNCKRSKCLKLYCECFAAGLYCIEPCSCRDCFNNPAHESTVLETRKQIEARNPLAFAPKVIRSTDFISEFGVETNKTPASARHKTGCNCKKSSCLKKYCECFQGGVGCSSNCRCEGCKNKFGSKNGFVENELEAEEFNSHEKNASKVILHEDMMEKSSREYSDIPIPSFAARGQRSELSPPVDPTMEPYDGRSLGIKYIDYNQTKSGKHLQVIPEDENLKVLTSDFSCKSGVKSCSPNSKRVSPPHHGFGPSTTWRSGKFILRSVPPFPSLNSPSEQ